MKILEVSDNKCLFYINNINLSKYDLLKESDIEKLLKKVLLIIKNIYSIVFSGFYEIDVYKNDLVVLFEIKKIDDYVPYNNIELRINYIDNALAFFKTKNYDVVKKYKKIYYYKDYYYVLLSNGCDELLNYIEFGYIDFDKDVVFKGKKLF